MDTGWEGLTGSHRRRTRQDRSKERNLRELPRHQPANHGTLGYLRDDEVVSPYPTDQVMLTGLQVSNFGTGLIVMFPLD